MYYVQRLYDNVWRHLIESTSEHDCRNTAIAVSQLYPTRVVQAYSGEVVHFYVDGSTVDVNSDERATS